MVKSAVLGGLVALALLVAPGAPGGVSKTAMPSASPTIKQFVVNGVYTREQRSQLVREGYDIGEAYWPDRVHLYGTDKQALMLSLRGFRVVPGEQPDDFPPPDSNYHNYAEMTADLQALAAAHPNTVHLISLGTSYENRNLIGVRISDDATDNLSEPGVFFIGQHHAREHLTVEVVLGLAHMFAEQPLPSNLLKSRQIYIFPSLNPDGSEYDIASGNYEFWRKNRQPNAQAVGTDNNRNYSYKWGCCGGSSGNGGSETYRGPSALSTPEDTAVKNFMVAHTNVKTGISFHTYGDLVMWPYGYTFEDIPPDMTTLDHSTFVAMGTEVARTTGYTPQQSSDLYITDGDWNDFMYGELHRYPLTIEMTCCTFYPGDEIIPSETRKNYRGAIFIATIADCPTRIVGTPCQ